MKLETFTLSFEEKDYTVTQKVVMVSEKQISDINGNPVYLTACFYVSKDGLGEQWNPEGFSKRKDGKYRSSHHHGENATNRLAFEHLQDVLKGGH